jgi:hypothetical protein
MSLITHERQEGAGMKTKQVTFYIDLVPGWQDWKDKKPIRFRFDAKPERPVDPQKPVKHFWAMVVWDYAQNKLVILEITQSTIQTTLKGLAKDPDWGDPKNYDIKVFRKGAGMDTEYSVTPAPAKPLPQEVLDQYEIAKIDLDALFDGKDPFLPF